jgi:phage baseplate assembly protein W
MNNTTKFTKGSVGSLGKIADFTPKITSRGDFSRIVDIDVILNSWNNLLLTSPRTYMHDPNYGCNLMKFIFEPADDTTIEAIKEEIKIKFMTYDNRASLDDIQVAYLSNQKGFVIDIYVTYKGDRGRLSAVIDENTYFDFLG